MNLVHDLGLRDEEGQLRAVVEAPRGAQVKLKYDDQMGVFTWSRPLPMGVAFPYDFGFFPQTLSGDGDALDAVVMSDVPSWPGVVVTVRAVAVLQVEQQRDGGPVKRNDRILAVPVNAHRRDRVRDLSDISSRICNEIAAFYQASLALTGKQIKLGGWADAVEAVRLVDAAHTAYQQARAAS